MFRNNLLIAVAGKDVYIQDLKDMKGILTDDAIINELLSRSQTIKKADNINPCEIQVLLLDLDLDLVLDLFSLISIS